jgi:uncharacterized protein YbcV (DUF1398 family)
MFSQFNMEIQRAVLDSREGVASNIFYVRPKDIRYITENKDHFLSTLKQALQELVDSKKILLKESSTSTISKKPSFAV